MLIRVLLAVQNVSLRRHICKSLPDAMVEAINIRKLFWERFAHVNVDCIVIDRALLPEPEVKSIAHLHQLPDALTGEQRSRANDPLAHIPTVYYRRQIYLI